MSRTHRAPRRVIRARALAGTCTALAQRMPRHAACACSIGAYRGGRRVVRDVVVWMASASGRRLLTLIGAVVSRRQASCARHRTQRGDNKRAYLQPQRGSNARARGAAHVHHGGASAAGGIAHNVSVNNAVATNIGGRAAPALISTLQRAR